MSNITTNKLREVLEMKLILILQLERKWKVSITRTGIKLQLSKALQ